MFSFIMNNKTLLVLGDAVGFAVKEGIRPDTVVFSVFRQGVADPRDITITIKEAEQRACVIQISEMISHWNKGNDFCLRITSTIDYTEVKQ